MRKYQKGSNNLPKYIQLTESIIRDIASGRLLDGERLPPEKVMAKSLGVAVGTLRKCLKVLSEKKLVKQIQGSGNYVCYVSNVSSIYSMFRLELHQGGGFPTAKVVSLKCLKKPNNFPTFGTSESGIRIRRLRYLDKILIAIEEIWLDSGVGVLKLTDLNDSIYQVYQNKLGIWISSVEDRVSIKQVPNWAPKSFSIPVRALSGFVERFGWTNSKHSVEYSRTWFDFKKAHYVQRLR